jgi:short-subunit dehydrogenase
MSESKGYAVITGASSGIGYVLAKLFANDGYPLLLAARSADKLATFAERLRTLHRIPVGVCALDLADPRAPEQMFAAARGLDRPVEVLVNNAGFGSYGPFVESDLADTLQMLQLNVVTLTHLTRLLLPGMVERNTGRIMNVASTAAFQPGPLMAVYYATKAYVLHFSEALDEELRDTAVRVCAFCPGPTATGFKSRAKLEDSKLFDRTQNLMDATAVAEVGYRALMRGQRLVIPGFWNKILSLSIRVGPRRLVTAAVRRMQTRRAPVTDSTETTDGKEI